MLLIIVLGGTTLFLLISLLVPSSYEAKTELMPPELPSDITFKILRRLGPSGTDRPRLGISAGLLIRILDSDTVHNRVINRFDLRRIYGVVTFAAAQQELAKRTSVYQDRRSGIIALRLVDHDPRRASAIAQALKHMSKN